MKTNPMTFTPANSAILLVDHQPGVLVQAPTSRTAQRGVVGEQPASQQSQASTGGSPSTARHAKDLRSIRIIRMSRAVA